ncbi:MAG: methyltransferase domain-containing protein [Pseudonocardia sp.]
MSMTAEYLLGAGEEERVRLIAGGEVYRSETEWLVDRTGVGPAARALDIGCGPLGILDILSQSVDSAESVIGVDSRPRMLEMARESLAERGIDGVQLLVADAAGTGLPADTFDLVHTRFVLINVPNPEQVVAEMARLTRPGGCVIVQDADFITKAVCEPPHPAWDRLLDVVLAVWDDSGFDPYIGRRLPNLLRAAGLVDVEVTVTARVWRSADAYRMLMLAVADVVREQIVALGLMTGAELDAVVAEVSEHLQRPDTFVMNYLFFQAWGRKPAQA